jgi:ERCC4-type nuclease
MHPVEVKSALNTLTVYADTREQDTDRAKKRYEVIGLPVERKKLPFGDYSAFCTLPNGEVFSLEDKVAVERKMSIAELCNCYCKDRPRFEREFERAMAVSGKVYMLIEDATWENIYAGKYRSKMAPNSLVASILAWLARYDCQVIFCKQETSGKLIRDILYREMKEHLEQLEDEKEDEHGE